MNSVQEIAAMPWDTPAETFEQMLEACDWEQFTSMVVAAACRRVPPALTQVLNHHEYHEDQIDALMHAIGNLQVTVMRRRYERGALSDEVTRLRTEITRVWARIHTLRRQRQTSTADADRQRHAQGWAVNRLQQFHPKDWEELLEQAHRIHGAPTPWVEGPTRSSLPEWIGRSGYPCPPLDDIQQRIVSASPQFVRNAVAKEVNDSAAESMFDHPLLLQPWMDALEQIEAETRELLGIGARMSKTVLLSDADLVIDQDTPTEQAFSRINRFRFLVAVLQRQMQASRAARRHLSAAADWWRPRAHDPARQTAIDALVALHRDEYAYLLDSYDPKKIGTAGAQQMRVRRRVLPQVLSELLNNAVRLGWDVELFTPDIPGGQEHYAFPGRTVVQARRGADSFPSVSSVFRHHGSWAPVRSSALMPGKPYRWVTFGGVGDLIALLSMSDADIAAAVMTQHNRNSRHENRHLLRKS